MKTGKFKRRIVNVFSSNASDQVDVVTTQKIVLLNILFAIGIPMLAVFGIFSFVNGRVLTGIIEHASIILIIFSYIHMRKSHHFLLAGSITTVMIFVLFTLLFVEGGVESSGHVWSFAMPLFLLFLFGVKWGTVITLGFLATVLFILQLPKDLVSHHDYTLNFLTRYLAAFIVIYVIAYVFEYVHNITNQTLQQKNIELEHTVNELRSISKSLKESERRFRELADLLPQPVFEADLRGNITYLSRSGFELSGYSEHDFTDNFDALMMFVPEDRERIRQNTLKIFKNQKLGGVQYRILKKDGSILPVIINAAPIFKEDRIAGSRGIIMDISELKRAEAEKSRLEEKLAISEKMEALGQLAGGVAHDLNNILNAIVGYPDLLLLNLPKKSKLRKPILTMKKSGQKAAAIVQDLLTLARRGAAGKQPVNLNSIVTDYIRSPECEKLRHFHPELEITSILDPGLLNIKGSDIHLAKTIMNLVSNAAESMPSGGVIELSTSNKYLEQTIKGYDKPIPHGNYVTFKISDQGIGIPRNRLKKIFEPFYTQKTLGRSGTGLGMAVVWGTVVDHDGFIVINSSPNKGTVFELYFPPSIEKNIKKRVKIKLNDYRGNQEKILVVDDIEEQREIASSILTKLYYQVDTVSSGEDALEYLRSNHPDLVILDMIMFPGIDGLDTFTKMQKLRPNIKTIITSGYSETVRVKRAIKMGVGSYIRKPYTMETLGLAVRNQLKQ
jgi:two-component system cell cycle sensor histidine kinase/response regulator CckA